MLTGGIIGSFPIKDQSNLIAKVSGISKEINKIKLKTSFGNLPPNPLEGIVPKDLFDTIDAIGGEIDKYSKMFEDGITPESLAAFMGDVSDKLNLGGLSEKLLAKLGITEGSLGDLANDLSLDKIKMDIESLPGVVTKLMSRASDLRDNIIESDLMQLANATKNILANALGVDLSLSEKLLEIDKMLGLSAGASKLLAQLAEIIDGLYALSEDAFLLAVEKAYEVGADPDYGDKYLRKHSIPVHDMSKVLDWYDGVRKRVYYHDTPGILEDLKTACEAGSTRVFMNVLNSAADARKKLIVEHTGYSSQVRVFKDKLEIAKKDGKPDDPAIRVRVEAMEEALTVLKERIDKQDNFLVKIIKQMIIYGRTNFGITTYLDSFNMIRRLDRDKTIINPSMFSDGGKFGITDKEIDIMVPLDPDNDSLILPKNSNIKLIYIFLIADKLHGGVQNTLEHTPLHTRLNRPMVKAKEGPPKIDHGRQGGSNLIYELAKNFDPILYRPPNKDLGKLDRDRLLPKPYTERIKSQLPPRPDFKDFSTEQLSEWIKQKNDKIKQINKMRENHKWGGEIPYIDHNLLMSKFARNDNMGTILNFNLNYALYNNDDQSIENMLLGSITPTASEEERYLYDTGLKRAIAEMNSPVVEKQDVSGLNTVPEPYDPIVKLDVDLSPPAIKEHKRQLYKDLKYYRPSSSALSMWIYRPKGVLNG